MEASSQAKAARLTCSVCGKTFSTQLEMQEHTKRDHVEQKGPAGVS